MSLDFAKLLNNCSDRIDNTNETETNESKENKDAIQTGVRPEIMDIIEDKIKKTAKSFADGDQGIERNEKQKNELQSEAKNEKAKILFSLKDFFERSNTKQSSEEDEEDGDTHSFENKDVNAKADDDMDGLEPKVDFQETLPGKRGTSSGNQESSKEDPVRSESDDDSDIDLESELSQLDKLKEKLDETILENSLVDGYGDRKECNTTSESIMKTEELKKENKNDTSGTVDIAEESTLQSPSSSIPSDTNVSNVNKKVGGSKDLGLKGAFKNISISVVGGKSSGISIESLLAKASATTNPPPPAQNSMDSSAAIFRPGSSISIKRGAPSNSDLILGSKHFKKPSMSTEEQSKRKKSVPTVTLDETVTIEDVTDDETDIVPTNYDDCNHGDLVDYMCMDCTLKRWETEWDVVKPPTVASMPRFYGQGLTLTKVTVKSTEPPKVNSAENREPSKAKPREDRETPKVNPAEDREPSKMNPAEIMQSVNWEKVFKYAGVQMENNIKS